ncbi:hypothetical protein, partial [Pusillimonas sp. T2]|uniref:hypothetical protein n=1 Tax=Pusillimonas sp. T2 TaxID=1548123 RepID=UPI001C1FC3DB
CQSGTWQAQGQTLNPEQIFHKNIIYQAESSGLIVAMNTPHNSCAYSYDRVMVGPSPAALSLVTRSQSDPHYGAGGSTAVGAVLKGQYFSVQTYAGCGSTHTYRFWPLS